MFEVVIGNLIANASAYVSADIHRFVVQKFQFVVSHHRTNSHYALAVFRRMNGECHGVLTETQTIRRYRAGQEIT